MRAGPKAVLLFILVLLVLAFVPVMGVRVTLQEGGKVD